MKWVVNQTLARCLVVHTLKVIKSCPRTFNSDVVSWCQSVVCDYTYVIDEDTTRCDSNLI